MHRGNDSARCSRSNQYHGQYPRTPTSVLFHLHSLLFHVKYSKSQGFQMSWSAYFNFLRTIIPVLVPTGDCLSGLYPKYRAWSASRCPSTIQLVESFLSSPVREASVELLEHTCIVHQGNGWSSTTALYLSWQSTVRLLSRSTSDHEQKAI